MKFDFYFVPAFFIGTGVYKSDKQTIIYIFCLCIVVEFQFNKNYKND